MTNSVSLHKGWIAKTAGLFIVTALAIAYFAFPVMAAVNPQNLNVLKLQSVKNDTKVKFMGLVFGAMPVSMTQNTGTLSMLRYRTLPLQDLERGQWIAVSVTKVRTGTANTAALNANYPWPCTIFNITKRAQTANIECVLGQPANSALTPPDLMKEIQGKLVKFSVTAGPDGNVTIPASEEVDSGWGAGALPRIAAAPSSGVNVANTKK